MHLKCNDISRHLRSDTKMKMMMTLSSDCCSHGTISAGNGIHLPCVFVGEGEGWGGHGELHSPMIFFFFFFCLTCQGEMCRPSLPTQLRVLRPWTARLSSRPATTACCSAKGELHSLIKVTG